MTLPFSISGIVVKGNQLGRKLGYPTANLYLPDASKFHHLTGVYAATVTMEEGFFRGMSSIGFRPTLSDPSFTVEVYIFGFDKDIYGQTITIMFLERLRDELKFNSLDDLVRQMQKDETAVQKTLSLLLKPDADSQ